MFENENIQVGLLFASIVFMKPPTKRIKIPRGNSQFAILCLLQKYFF